MNRIISILTLAVIIPLIGIVTIVRGQHAQRINDQQVKFLLDRIEKGADGFRGSLKDALSQTRFDETRAGVTSEDNINQFVKDLIEATDRLKNRFSDDNAAVGLARDVLQPAARINSFMQRHWLTPYAQSDWRHLRDNLNQLARAYHVGWSWTGSSMRPYRVSEEQMKNLLERIEKGADSFRGSLRDALGQGRFDDTRREDNINQFVHDFEAATDRLEDRFDDDYSAVGAAGEVLRRAARIDNFMRRHQLQPRAQSDWLALKRDLDELARAYSISMNWSGSTIIIQP